VARRKWAGTAEGLAIEGMIGNSRASGAKIKNLAAPEPEIEKKAAAVVDLIEALRRSFA
jgi:hypothetical protein